MRVDKALRDIDVRDALYAKMFGEYHNNPSTLVLKGLDLWYAVTRVAIAVVNNCMQNVKNKNDLNTLDRLPRRVRPPDRGLDRDFVGIEHGHAEEVRHIATGWRGIKVTMRDRPGGSILPASGVIRTWSQKLRPGFFRHRTRGAERPCILADLHHCGSVEPSVVGRSSQWATIMHLSLQKEQFSYAYIHAVCASAGFDCNRKQVDNESVDLAIMADRKRVHRAPRLELQVKCRTNVELRDDDFSIPIPRNNYEDLRDPHVYVPRILVVVIVPTNHDEWLHQCEDYATIKHCGYWRSLRDEPELDNPAQESVTVRLRREHVFTVKALTEMMSTISTRGVL